MTDVQVATAVAADGTPDPASYVSIDAVGTVKNALATTSVRIRFDRFLLPIDTFRQSICVQSDLKPVKSLRDCTPQRVYFEPSYDPVHRELTFRQSVDVLPHMAAGATYRVTIFPADSNGANGIAAFDGARLKAVTSFTFTTSTPTPSNAVVEQIPTSNVFCKQALVALSNCSYGGCHLDKTDTGGFAAAEGLQMYNGDQIAQTAVGHVAHQTQEGEQAQVGDRSGLRFGRAMPIIDPHFPGNSYLLYKVLTAAENTRNVAIDAGSDAGDDAGSDAGDYVRPSDPPSDPEVARLRASVVVGMPMPPTNAMMADLTPATLDAISTWILQGAPTVCP